MILVLSSLSSEVVTIFCYIEVWWSVVAITRGFLCRRSFIDQGLFPRINPCVTCIFHTKVILYFFIKPSIIPRLHRVWLHYPCVIFWPKQFGAHRGAIGASFIKSFSVGDHSGVLQGFVVEEYFHSDVGSQFIYWHSTFASTTSRISEKYWEETNYYLL